MATTTLMPVEFAGATLYIINQDGIPFTPMKPIVEAMGLDWSAQHAKLKSNSTRWGIGEISTPSTMGEIAIVETVGEIVTQTPSKDGKTRSMSCIPLRKLPGWMMTIHPNKVKDTAVRERIVRYQNECDDVLWDYWNKANAQLSSNHLQLPSDTSSIAPYSVHPGQTLSEDQAQTLRSMLDEFVKTLPKEKQGVFMTKGWSKLKAHFGVGYREIPAAKFTDAVSIIARHIVEYSAPALEAPKQAELDFSIVSFKNKRLLHIFDHNGSEIIQRVPNDAMVVSPSEIPGLLLNERNGIFTAKDVLEIAGHANLRMMTEVCSLELRSKAKMVRDEIRTFGTTDLSDIAKTAWLELSLRGEFQGAQKKAA